MTTLLYGSSENAIAQKSLLFWFVIPVGNLLPKFRWFEANP
jgi:hypothetical protein